MVRSAALRIVLVIGLLGLSGVTPVQVAASAFCGNIDPTIVGGRSNVTSGAVLQAQASFNKINPQMCTGSTTQSISACWVMGMRLGGSFVADGYAQIGWVRWVKPVQAGVPSTDAVPFVEAKNQGTSTLSRVFGSSIEPAGPTTWKVVYSTQTDAFSFYRAGSTFSSPVTVNFEPNQSQYACEAINVGDDIGGLSSGSAIRFRTIEAQFSTGGGLDTIALTKYEATPKPQYKRLWYTNADGSNSFDDYTSR